MSFCVVKFNYNYRCGSVIVEFDVIMVGDEGVVV